MIIPACRNKSSFFIPLDRNTFKVCGLDNFDGFVKGLVLSPAYIKHTGDSGISVIVGNSDRAAYAGD